jgi:hypothetical protein
VGNGCAGPIVGEGPEEEVGIEALELEIGSMAAIVPMNVEPRKWRRAIDGSSGIFGLSFCHAEAW